MSDGTHARLQDVRNRLTEAEEARGRQVGEVKLVAVSKTFGPEAIRPVIEAGQTIFGENKVQESQGKWPELRKEYPNIELHLIGPLQTNKVRDAVGLFDCIQTLDRPKLARALAKEFALQAKQPELFVQVNTGQEPQKAGILPSEVDDFLQLCRDEFGLRASGLMCIPPFDEEPSLHFALLKKIADRNALAALSMGMSSDFETAIAFGATHVRVGSAIFGARSYTPG